MARLFRLAFVLVPLLAWVTPGQAEKRVALVIGNGAYAKVSKLPNPVNDAAAVEAMLKAARFDKVVRASDLGAVQMRRLLRDFSDDVRGADIAVVFYAGHGMEMNGVNYLIPVDAVLERDIDVEDETVSLDRVNQALEQAKRLRLIMLDACRDNPFVRSMKRTLAGRSIGRGLARVDVVSSDTLIAYAAKAGSIAADGDGANSPYTMALAKHLMTPALDVRLALGRVRDEVLRTTKNRQEPFVYGSLGGSEIPLVAGKAPEPPTAGQMTATTAEAEAAAAWPSIRDTKSTTDLEAFIKRYGATFHGDLARGRLAELRRLALLTKESERKATEASAAKSANDQEKAMAAAKERAEADVIARAETERQRLAMLDQQRQAEARKAASLADSQRKVNEDRELAAQAESRRIADQERSSAAERKALSKTEEQRKLEAERKAGRKAEGETRPAAGASKASAECTAKYLNHSNCSHTLNTCSRHGGTVKACNTAHAECLRTGRWVYRKPSGECIDWGSRHKS